MYGSLAHSSFSTSGVLQGIKQYIRVNLQDNGITGIRSLVLGDGSFLGFPSPGLGIIHVSIAGSINASAYITFVISSTGGNYTDLGRVQTFANEDVLANTLLLWVQADSQFNLMIQPQKHNTATAEITFNVF